jgi:hypothetical protein
VQSDEQPRSETGQQLDGVPGQLLTCPPAEIRPHPSYDRNNLAVSSSQLAALAALGDLAFREPLLITGDRTIVDGYARWKLAQLTNRPLLLCMEYQLDETEALQLLLRTHRRLNGFIAFNRIGLALDLKPFFQEMARSNRRVHRQSDGSSNLTRVDVRTQIAIEAGVSTGNVTKFEQVIKTAHPKVQQAARAGEISLHKAWKWRNLSPGGQLSELHLDQAKKGTKGTIRQLIRKHVEKQAPALPRLRSLRDLLRGSAAPESKALDSIAVIVINVPGNIAFLTPGAIQTLGGLEE